MDVSTLSPGNPPPENFRGDKLHGDNLPGDLHPAGLPPGDLSPGDLPQAQEDWLGSQEVEPRDGGERGRNIPVNSDEYEENFQSSSEMISLSQY